MKNYPSPSLQSGQDCVAFAFAYAIELALSKHHQQYWQRIDRKELVALFGAPADVRVAYKKLLAKYNWLGFYVQIKSMTDSLGRIEYPCVATTWRDGFAHAIVLIDPITEYDPAKGEVGVSYRCEMMATFVQTLVVDPPVVCKWRKYAVYRWLEELGWVGWA